MLALCHFRSFPLSFLFEPCQYFSSLLTPPTTSLPTPHRCSHSQASSVQLVFKITFILAVPHLSCCSPAYITICRVFLYIFWSVLQFFSVYPVIPPKGEWRRPAGTCGNVSVTPAARQVLEWHTDPGLSRAAVPASGGVGTLACLPLCGCGLVLPARKRKKR